MEHNQGSVSPFRVTVGDQCLVGQPAPTDMMKVLIMLDDSEDGFLVLERGPECYMQCCGTTSTGYAVEYRDGSDDRHFVSVDDSVRLGITNDLFISYLKEDGRWREIICWEPLGDQDARPVRKTKGKCRGLVTRHGNTVVINKRWCMVASGLACYALGAVIFLLLSSITIYGGANIGGPLLALGTVILILSCFTGD